jgi:hypothetical protein
MVLSRIDDVELSGLNHKEIETIIASFKNSLTVRVLFTSGYWVEQFEFLPAELRKRTID